MLPSCFPHASLCCHRLLADFDFGKAKAFPMRDQHFFASIDKVGAQNSEPELRLAEGYMPHYCSRAVWPAVAHVQPQPPRKPPPAPLLLCV